MHSTNYWDSSIAWNGVIFPATIDSVQQPYTKKSAAIRLPQEYLSRDEPTGEISFDLHFLAKNSNKKVTDNIKRIDEIRKLKTPWLVYLTIFVLFMVGTIVACYYSLTHIRISQSTLIPICIVFIICLAITIGLLTFLSIQQEEVVDCRKLTKLQNEIRAE